MRLRHSRLCLSNLIAFLSSLALIGLAPLRAAAQGFGNMGSLHPQPTATLEGHVRSELGGPAPPGTMVVLETLSGEIALQQPVDSTGGFEIQDVPKARYILSIKANGFQPYERQINLSYGVGQYFLDVQLSPQTTVVRRPPPALTDDQAPKAARKELEKGQRALNKGDAKKARHYLEAAVKVFPCYARAQTDLGLTLSTMHKYGPAETALRKAIECDPGFLESYTVLGQLLNAENRYSESEVVLQKGLRLSPGSWQFYYQLGVAEFGQGKYTLAADQFRRAEGMTPPPPPDVHLKLADAYVKLESYADAYREMGAYLKAQPHGVFAARARQVMQQMKAAGVVRQPSTSATAPPPPPR